MDTAAKRILVILPNWIGDVVMSLPALQCLKEQRADVELHVACRPFLRPLAEASPVIDRVHDLPSDNLAFFRACKVLSGSSFDQIIVFPNSFRSGLAARLVGAAKRTGVAGHKRGFLLSDVRPVQAAEGREHQVWEYLALCDVSCAVDSPPFPEIRLSPSAKTVAETLLLHDRPYWVGFVPGAARGESKAWPEDHYRELGRLIHRYSGAGIALFGGPDDVEKCERLKKSLGESTLTFAGKTSLPEWFGLLNHCRCVVANDSGGMHIAAALGRPVIGLYGITDPQKTGPLGPWVKVLKKSKRASRDIPRHSEEAQSALRAIKPEEVWAELNQLMDRFMEETVDA